MNLGRLFEVLGRFKYLVLCGLLAAVVLSTLSYVKVGLDGGTPRLEPRSQPTWASSAKLLVTQEGFPYGRSVLDEVVPLEQGEAGYVPRYADGGRFVGLALLYSELAKADAVRELMLRDGPIHGAYELAVVRSADGSALPLLDVRATAQTAEDAEHLAERATTAFLSYLGRLQAANEIAADRRVQVQVVEQPREAVIVEGRKKTKPIFLFILLTSATVMAAFALESLRPRGPAIPEALSREPRPWPEAARRKSA